MKVKFHKMILVYPMFDIENTCFDDLRIATLEYTNMRTIGDINFNKN